MKKNSITFRTIALVLSLILCFSHTTNLFAAPIDSYEKTTVSLISTEIDKDSIELYIYEDIHFITIEDLCKLTRTKKTVEDNKVTLTQGFWSGFFDIKEQYFDDGYQKVDIIIFENKNGDYCVPALMFLAYFGATAYIQDEKLFCLMPEFTAWEALDVDYDNSLVDIYDLYGGETNVAISLTCDILMDYILGEGVSIEGYQSDAFKEMLAVDINDSSSVEEHIEKSTYWLYNFTNSEKGKITIDTLEETVNDVKDRLPSVNQGLEAFAKLYYNAFEKEALDLGYQAVRAGNKEQVIKYAEKVADAYWHSEKNIKKINKASNIAGITLLILSSAIETAQQMKYADATNNLLYKTMGTETMKEIGIEPLNNGWFELANTYKNTGTNFMSQLLDIAVEEYANGEIFDNIIDLGVTSAAKLKAGVFSVSLAVARIIAKNAFFLEGSIEGSKSDRQALFLSELQQNAYWLVANVVDKFEGNYTDLDLYNSYILAEQLYCRTSIAMYENLITMVEEFGKNREYWINEFTARINDLEIELYKLTRIHEDGLVDCLPMKLDEFSLKTNIDSNKFWKEFLDSGKYKNYLNNAWNTSSLEYALYDVNNDGVLELLIQETTDEPFYYTWLFAISKNKPVLVNEKYGYGQFRYSPDYNSVLVSPETKPYAYAGVTPFYRLKGTDFYELFSIIQDEGITYYSNDSGKKKIIEEERIKYFSNLVYFEWSKLVSVKDVQEDKYDMNFLLGSWYSEGYGSTAEWAGSYKTEFNENGTVSNEGHRNKDIGTYVMLDEKTILATFDENYVDVPGKGYQALEYTYTVTYKYDQKNNTLYAEYDDVFQKECMSNANSGTLYR